MKVLVMVLAASFSLQSFAQEQESKPEVQNVEARKAEMLKNIDERIAKLNEHKTCVSAAPNKEALKKCHESMKEFRNDQKEQWKEKREERKEKRKERKEKKE